ncbi:hypothetical protein BDR26DRAFT_852168 [Obelidium mucronatum]|nr:hypothetical protein BDR26DRAFT_852160 [Obelidium mucronatum]KAI9350304.1 hypothetical protein BDR26DRAFT_852168 [Obelidium mucronatum]
MVAATLEIYADDDGSSNNNDGNSNSFSFSDENTGPTSKPTNPHTPTSPIDGEAAAAAQDTQSDISSPGADNDTSDSSSVCIDFELQSTSAPSEELLPDGNDGLRHERGTLEEHELAHRDRRRRMESGGGTPPHAQARRLFADSGASSATPYTLFVRRLPAGADDPLALALRPPAPMRIPEATGAGPQEDYSSTQILLGSRPDILTADGQINPGLIQMINEAKSFLVARQAARRGGGGGGGPNSPRVPIEEHASFEADIGRQERWQM